MRAVRILVRGRVQGVGFRYFTLRAAQAAGVAGWVRNLADGTVEALARGTPESLAQFRAALRDGPRGAHVSALDESEIDGDSVGAAAPARFEIR